MGLIKRGLVFSIITGGNAILFLFYSRVYLRIKDLATQFPAGPATPAINLIPDAIMLAIAAIQVGVTLYFVFGLQSERARSRRVPR